MSDELIQKLIAEFSPEHVQLKAKNVNKERTKCLAVPYLDARDVAERLTEVFGLGGWSINHQVVSEKCIKSTLTIQIGERTAIYDDFGYSDASDNQPGPEHLKAAASDGLKRCAVPLGVGRYLYRLEGMWCDAIPIGEKGTRPKPANLAELIKVAGKGKPASSQPPAQDAAKPEGAPPLAATEATGEQKKKRPLPRDKQVLVTEIAGLCDERGWEEKVVVQEVSLFAKRQIHSWHDMSVKELAAFRDHLRKPMGAG
mgnify:CR=1 FL=1